MNAEEVKLKVKNTFNLVSEGYDLPELRFFENSADYLVDLLDLKGDEKILDICTGTGHIPLRLSKKLPKGSVTGIDISENMIMKAKEKAVEISNIKFISIDLDEYSHENKKYDIVTCAFGIFFFPDMSRALQQMKKLLKPNGKIILSNFDTPFMEPQRVMLIEKLNKYNIHPSSSLWMEINTEVKFKSFLSKNDFNKIEMHKNQSGYFLKNAEEWWKIIINTNMRSNLNGLSENDLPVFKNEHLTEVNKLNKDNKGIWLDVRVLYAECFL